MQKIIVINSGSSSLKFQIFEHPGRKVLAKGLIERIGLENSVVTIKYGDKQKYTDTKTIKDHHVAVSLLLDLLQELEIVTDLNEIVGVGHRVVAGGEYFKHSVPIDQHVIDRIDELTELAPLHNPANLVGIKAFKKLLPNAVSVASFDTAFHQSIPEVNYMYSAPYEWYEKYKVRRYGAHGISHRYVANRAAEMMGKPLKDLRLITCHLGAGASITAVKDGKSFDTSMGFTPLTGITMATRSGDIDVSLVAYMMKKLKVKSVSEILYILNKESGLKGISGISADMRDVEEAAWYEGNKRARLALDIFEKDVIKYVGQYMAEMGGVDGVVFTAGVGENSPEIREAIANMMGFLGAEIDHEKNKGKGEAIISTPNSKVALLRIPTNEEYMICCDVEEILAQSGK